MGGRAGQDSRSRCARAKGPPAPAVHLREGARDTKASARPHHHPRARPRFCPLGQRLAPKSPDTVDPKGRIGLHHGAWLATSGRHCARVPHRPRASARTPRVLSRTGELVLAGTRATAPAGGDAECAPHPSPPRGRACAVVTRGRGSFKAGAEKRTTPPSAPPRGEASARCAQLFVRFSGGGGGERVRRDTRTGTASCAPSRRSRGPFLEAARRKEALRGGPALGRCGTGASALGPLSTRSPSAPAWRCPRQPARAPRSFVLPGWLRPLCPVCQVPSADKEAVWPSRGNGLSWETARCHGVTTGLVGRRSPSPPLDQRADASGGMGPGRLRKTSGSR